MAATLAALALAIVGCEAPAAVQHSPAVVADATTATSIQAVDRTQPGATTSAPATEPQAASTVNASAIVPGAVHRTSLRISATYDVRIRLSMATRRVSGTVEIEASNRSGDGIDRILLNTVMAKLGRLDLGRVTVDGRRAKARIDGQTIVVPLGGVLPDGATATIVAQCNLYLTTGTRLISSEGNTLLTIVADTCGRHDTLGGACAAESNQVRYAIEKRFMHSCRDSFLLECAVHQPQLGKRDLTSNINFFMNVPVTEDGALRFADGVSAAGRYVELYAEMDVLLVISNCPQLNNPCNAYNPTPIEVLVFQPAQDGA